MCLSHIRSIVDQLWPYQERNDEEISAFRDNVRDSTRASQKVLISIFSLPSTIKF